MTNFMKKNLESQVNVGPGKHDDRSSSESEDKESIRDARGVLLCFGFRFN